MVTDFDAGDRLLNVEEVAGLLGVSKATVWRRTSDGTLPRPIRLGGSSRWVLRELLNVIEKAKADRDAAVAVA